MEFLKSVPQSRPVQHGLFWGLSYYILLRVFLYEPPSHAVDYVYTFLFHFSLLIIVYLNLVLLIPLFLKKGKYGIYGLTFIGTLLLGIAINFLTFNFLSDLLFPGYYFISYYNFWDLTQFMLVYLSISTLLKLSRAWFEVNEKDKTIKVLQNQKLQAELAALKHQIDPHFLFNNLNAIYNMTLDNSEKAGDALLRLADNMRYVLYRTDEQEVPLGNEVNFLETYIDLQKMRLDETKVDILFSHQIENAEQPVAPLLFLPFVENAFKHGLIGSKNGKSIIQISLSLKANVIHFFIKNTFKEKKNKGVPKSEGGIGLKNVKSRLDKLYARQHQLEIKKTTDFFEVALTIFPNSK